MVFKGSELIEVLMGQLIEMVIRNQLSDVEEIDVDIRAALAQMLQGEAIGLSVHSKGLWLTPDLQLDVLDVEISRLSVAFQEAMQGDFGFAKPLDLVIELKISEASLNRFLASSIIRDWAKTVVFLEQQSQAFSLNLHHLVCRLASRQLFFDLRARIHRHETTDACSSAVIAVSGSFQVASHATNRDGPVPIYLQDARFKPDRVPLLIETSAILSWVSQLIGWRYIENDAFSALIRSLNVTSEGLEIVLDAQVTQLKSLLSQLG